MVEFHICKPHKLTGRNRNTEITAKSPNSPVLAGMIGSPLHLCLHKKGHFETTNLLCVFCFCFPQPVLCSPTQSILTLLLYGRKHRTILKMQTNPIKIWKQNLKAKSLLRVAGPQTLETFYLQLPAMLAGSWMRNRVARTGTGAATLDGCSEQHLPQSLSLG